MDISVTPIDNELKVGEYFNNYRSSENRPFAEKWIFGRLLTTSFIEFNIINANVVFQEAYNV